jgi:hypothetical protein
MVERQEFRTEFKAQQKSKRAQANKQKFTEDYLRSLACPTDGKQAGRRVG